MCRLLCLVSRCLNTNEPFWGFFGCISSSLIRILNYLFSFPAWWVECDTSLSIFVTVSEDVDALKPSSVSNGKVSVGFGALIPLPYFTKDQPNGSGNCKSVGIEIWFVLYFPVSLGPKGHSIWHTSCWISHSCSESLRTVEYPLGKP